MFTLRLTLVFTIFMMGFSTVFSSDEPNTNFQPSIGYIALFDVNDSTIECFDPVTNLISVDFYDEKTVLKLLDGSLHTPTKSLIASHGYYKLITKSGSKIGYIDTLEQIFMISGFNVKYELNFGIINTTNPNNEIKHLNNHPYSVPIFSFNETFPTYNELRKEWFENNIGTYLLFGYYLDLSKKNRFVGSYRKLPNSKIENFTGQLLQKNGKEYRIFGKPIFVTESTKFYDDKGNPLTIEDFSVNDRIDIDFCLFKIEDQFYHTFYYNNDKYIAIRITKLPRNNDFVRYSEDVMKVSNDTIYTTSHTLRYSFIQSKLDVNGEVIDSASLFSQYRAITFEIDANSDRNEIRNVDFVHSTYRQRDSTNFRGTAIGMINSLQFPIMTFGVNLYEVGNGALIRNKFGDTTLANATTIPLNSLAKLFYERVEDGNETKYVVNFISLEDTSTFTSVQESVDKQINVFPNPITDGFATIEFKSIPNEQTTINLISSDGNIVISKRVPSQNNNISFKLDVRSISNGVYFVEIVGENRKQLQIFPIQILR